MRIRHSRPGLGPEEEQAACRALGSGFVGRGPECERFEAELAARLGVSHVRLTSSGTAALHIALLALGVVPGDEVVFPSYVCAAVLHAVRHCGAFPVPADVDGETLGLSPETVRRVWSGRVRAIVAVHPFGRVLDLDPLREFEVPIVEDAATALGGIGPRGPAGGQGTVGVCSFYATKIITTGHGGCIATSSKELYGQVVDLLAFDGRDEDRLRWNYEMGDVNAAIGRAQLGKLDELLQKRHELAAAYSARLAGCGITLPAIPADRSHVVHRYLVRTASRDRLAGWLLEAGIEAKNPVYRPAHRYMGADDAGFPGTVQADREVLSLPVHTALSVWEVEEVAGRVLECMKGA